MELISVFGGHTLQITRDSYALFGIRWLSYIYLEANLQESQVPAAPKTAAEATVFSISRKYHILTTLLFPQKSISLLTIFLNPCQFISTLITKKRNESKKNR